MLTFFDVIKYIKKYIANYKITCDNPIMNKTRKAGDKVMAGECITRQCSRVLETKTGEVTMKKISIKDIIINVQNPTSATIKAVKDFGSGLVTSKIKYAKVMHMILHVSSGEKITVRFRPAIKEAHKLIRKTWKKAGIKDTSINTMLGRYCRACFGFPVQVQDRKPPEHNDSEYSVNVAGNWQADIVAVVKALVAKHDKSLVQTVLANVLK